MFWTLDIDTYHSIESFPDKPTNHVGFEGYLFPPGFNFEDLYEIKVMNDGQMPSYVRVVAKRTSKAAL